MDWWFGILHLNQETPTLYGPYSTEAQATRAQDDKWRYRVYGEHTNPPFRADNEDLAKQAFMFTSLIEK